MTDRRWLVGLIGALLVVGCSGGEQRGEPAPAATPAGSRSQATAAGAASGVAPTSNATSAPATNPTAAPATAASGAAAGAPAAAKPGSAPVAAPGATPASTSGAGPAPSGTVLVVDDARAANGDLRDSPLQIPAGVSLEAQTVRLPAGFSMSVLAGGLRRPRFMAFDDAGSLLVADAGAGTVIRYPASGGAIAPAPTPPEPLARGLTSPSNVALLKIGGAEYLYVGETNQVSRFRYSTTGPVGDREVVIPNLPTGGHNTRTVAFGPDGKLYLAVGSSCNICDEADERRATVLRYNPDGSAYERFAWGLRNAVGLAFQPGTSTLWATVNERDNQGNEIPPDLVTTVTQGANYGWPGCQPPNAQPQTPGARCTGITPPTIGIQAHSAPLGLAFLTGNRFPERYRGDLFVVQHGSWNRQPPAAPKVLWLDFEGGRPVAVRDFATGWQRDGGSRWGRPAGVVAAPDGSLILSDDQGGRLYRISYSG